MERKHAELLIEELAKHKSVIPFDKDKFIKSLISVPIQESSRFYEILPEITCSSSESIERYYTLFLRRILRNRNTGNYRISLLKRFYDNVATKFKVYDSNIMTRRIRAEEGIIRIMLENENPFSLLAKIEDYECRDGSKRNFIIRRPLLIIPNILDKEKELIYDWEERNKTYGREVGILIRHEKRISSRSYGVTY